ncbi:MAG: HAD-IIB family hydrolase [Gammaproteobacteria bacterium]
MTQLLLCTDLDRTLVPNGPQPESPQARPMFKHLAAHPQVTLVYVSGRHQALVEEAVTTYDLPMADYVIGDVGSTLYRIQGTRWTYLQEWEQHIHSDWQSRSASELHGLISGIDALTLQEAEKQNAYKLSYYVSLNADHEGILANIRQTFASASIRAHVIWSIDEQAHVGLLDILPASAGKRQAIEFLMQSLGFDYDTTVFAGDSGNDIDVLCSPIPAVLVANASTEVRQAALKQARQQQADNLYLARGDFMGMNGNYSAGIIEGVVHYLPQVQDWLQVE